MATGLDGVREFFEAFERNSNALDAEALAGQFGDHFLGADPARATPVSRADFLDALPARRELFDSAGLLRTRLTSLTETALDADHVLAETTWVGELRGGDELPLGSSFILRRQGASWVVIFYLNHQDITRILEERVAASS